MSKEIKEIPQDWGMYLQGINEKPALTKTNLSLFRLAPIKSYDVRIQFAVYYMNQTESSLPSQEENPKLWEIEDALTEAIQCFDVIDVGLIKCEGAMNLFFYAKEKREELEQIEQSLIQTLSKEFEGYQWKIWFDTDKEWECYLETLYPNKYSMQEIKNNNVLEVLQSEGDDFSKERLIEHWAYFETEEACLNFIKKVQSEHFQLFSDDVIDNGQYRYQAGVSRNDSLDDIDEITWYLLDAAEEFGGFYDGWGCGLMK